MSTSAAPRRWLFLVLVVAAGIAYWPALAGSLVWDDDAHVTMPALQSLPGLGRIWTEIGATQQYYPILHTAFWIEHRLWGDATMGYHLLNVALHVGAAWLFVQVLLVIWVAGEKSREAVRMSAACLGGLAFALHPVAVESVAWISEQKNTLSAVFYLSAGLLYLRGRNWKSATALFICALLTKSVTATLPAALLVVVWYQRGRLSFRKDVVPLLPWFVFALAAGLFTAWIERTLLGATGADFRLTLVEHGLLASRIAAFYLGKLVWPATLVFIYPRWAISSGDTALYLYPLGWAAIIAFAARLAGRGWRGPLAATLFFLGTLFPALGFFNVYPFIFSYVADHFQYLAMLGPIAAAAGGWAAWRARDFSPRPVLAALLSMGLLAALSFRQAGNYRDPETLYRSVLAENASCWMADYNLAVTLHRENRIPEAAGYYTKALALRPQFPEAQNNLGVILIDAGQNAEAIVHLQAASAAYALNPRKVSLEAEAESNLGRALQQGGRDLEAISHFERALALGFDRAELRNNYAVALIRGGRPEEAEQQLEAALRHYPDDRTARENLLLLHRLKGT